MSASCANDSRARPNVSRSCIVAITVLRRRPRRPPPSPATSAAPQPHHLADARPSPGHRSLGAGCRPTPLLADSRKSTFVHDVRRSRRRADYDRRRRHRVPAASDQQPGDVLDPAQAHHHHDRYAVRRKALEDRTIGVLGVTGHDDEAGRHAAMRDRNAGEGRRRDRRAHARHDLERDPGRRERQRFFAAAAEDERVAALEPHDRLPARAARIISRWMDSCRTCGRPARLPTKKRCADGASASVAASTSASYSTRSASARRSAALPRQQIGIAGPGADQRDEATFGGGLVIESRLASAARGSRSTAARLRS